MHDRNAILAAVDLPALADEMLGPHHGTERTPVWPCPNPNHAQTGRTPPVNVFTSRRGEQRWRCHGCGDGGTAIDLIIATRGVDIKDAIDILATRAGRVPRPSDRNPPPRSPVPDPVAGCRDPQGLGDYVEACAQRLWTPAGEEIRAWLTADRRLPTEVLRANRVGADLGPGRQSRPNGMPRLAGAVLPAIVDGSPVYAQIRVPHPRPDRPRYLNPTGHLAPNPRLARFRPPRARHREVIVTEGAIDALTAAAGGYRAVAVLSAGYPDATVAHALSRLPHPLVIAFDADPAGRAGAQRLAALLDTHHRPAAIVDLEHGDLNDALLNAHDWPPQLEDRLRGALSRVRPAPALSR